MTIVRVVFPCSEAVINHFCFVLLDSNSVLLKYSLSQLCIIPFARGIIYDDALFRYVKIEPFPKFD